MGCAPDGRRRGWGGYSFSDFPHRPEFNNATGQFFSQRDGIRVGHSNKPIIILRNGATGYELRSSAPATVAINGGAGANAESAIAASTMVIAICTTATTWQAIGLAGTTLAAVEAAA